MASLSIAAEQMNEIFLFYLPIFFNLLQNNEWHTMKLEKRTDRNVNVIRERVYVCAELVMRVRQDPSPSLLFRSRITDNPHSLEKCHVESVSTLIG